MFKHFTSFAAVAAACLGVAASASAKTVVSHKATSTPACNTSNLRVQIVAGEPGAGQRFATLRLKNISKTACHTYGYIGMRFLNGKHGALRTHVIRNGGQRRVLVVKPGKSVSTLLHWDVIDGGGVCVTPSYVEVTPPDAYSHLTVRWNGGIVCQNGTVRITPLVYNRTYEPQLALR